MKSWLGTLSRACIEFLLALLLVGGAEALDTSLRMATPQTVATFREAVSAMLVYMPLAGLIALFLSFFTVESRVASRALGWSALILVAVLPLVASVALERFPLAQEIRQAVRPKPAMPKPLPAGMSLERGPLMLWIGAWQGNTALDAVGADFSSPQPRLFYSPRAPFDPARGVVYIEDRAFPAALNPPQPIELMPEAGSLSPWWIWDRLANSDGLSPLQAVAMAIGFGFLAAGLRFLARLTSWSLANAFLAAAGLLGILILDALLATPEAVNFVSPLLRRARLALPYPLLVATFEAFLGLLAGLIDLLSPSDRRRRLDA
jgi:hypothetical protein